MNSPPRLQANNNPHPVQQPKLLYNRPVTGPVSRQPAAGIINGVRKLATAPIIQKKLAQVRKTQDYEEEPHFEEEEHDVEHGEEAAEGEHYEYEDEEHLQQPVEGEQIIDTDVGYAPEEETVDGYTDQEEPVAEEHVEEQPVHETHEVPEEHHEEHDSGLSLITEREELKAAITMIEFKLTEINALMKECIEQEFTADIMSDSQTLMLSCTGLTYQILFHNFKEGMRRVKVIFLELLKKKMKSLDEEYDDEVDFFLDVLEEFIDKDYKLSESLEISKKNVKYYVSPRFYESLLAIAEPEIRAINSIHNRLKVSRKEVQDLIVKKMIERENYLKELDGQMHPAEPEEAEEAHAPSYEGEEEEESSLHGDGDEEYGDEEEGEFEGEGDEDEGDEGGDGSAGEPYDEEYDSENEGNEEGGDDTVDERQQEADEGATDDAEFDEKNSEDGS